MRQELAFRVAAGSNELEKKKSQKTSTEHRAADPQSSAHGKPSTNRPGSTPSRDSCILVDSVEKVDRNTSEFILGSSQKSTGKDIGSNGKGVVEIEPGQVSETSPQWIPTGPASHRNITPSKRTLERTFDGTKEFGPQISSAKKVKPTSREKTNSFSAATIHDPYINSRSSAERRASSANLLFHQVVLARFKSSKYGKLISQPQKYRLEVMMKDDGEIRLIMRVASGNRQIFDVSSTDLINEDHEPPIEGYYSPGFCVEAVDEVLGRRESGEIYLTRWVFAFSDRQVELIQKILGRDVENLP